MLQIAWKGGGSDMNELILSAEQKQSVSQQTIQIVEILQMSAQQLDAYLNEQMLSNPLIDPDASFHSDDEPLHIHVMEESWEPEGGVYRDPIGSAGMESWVPQAALSLSQRLFLQLLPYVESARDEQVLRYLIESMDDRGFLSDEPEHFCEKLKLDRPELEHYITILHKLEPAGLGARSLRECLQLQLAQLQSPYRDLAGKILSQPLQDITASSARRLAKELDVRESELQQALALIRSLNPRPSSGLESIQQTVYIRPDIIIGQEQDGFQIQLRQSRIHRLLVDAGYLELALDAPADVQAYIQEKKQNIDWINRCLEQRESTLMRLAVELLTRQKDFFLRGPGFLRPLDQAELSEAMEVSPSTISRAVRDKYLQCAWGIFPLKAFFPRAAVSDGTVTVDTAKDYIRTLIEGEDRLHPLSDQKICERLAAAGLPMSRRVIAKYRAEMGIPDTSRRRRNASD